MKPTMQRLWIVRHIAKPSIPILLLAAAGSAEAGWLDRGIGTAGAGTAVAATLERTTGIFDKMLDAVVKDDDKAVAILEREFEKTPGAIIAKAFPVLDAADAIADRVKSAKRKIGRFVDGAGEGLSDARVALATWGNRRSGSEAALLEGEPLLAPADTKFVEPRFDSPDEVLAALRGESGRKTGEAGNKPSASSSVFEQWVLSEQEGRPHCYGVVDTLPADCFGPLRAAKSAETEPKPDGAAGDGSDWASRDWTVEGSGWSGWDSTDSRYSDEDRQAARVGFFAARCWGVHGVSKHDPTWALMNERMARNECPNEEASRTSSGKSGNDYAKALGSALSGGAGVADGGSYMAALTGLEKREAVRRQVEQEERERQIRLEEEREHRARLKREEEWRERAEHGGSGSSRSHIKSVPFDLDKRPR
ncbi:MAG: hypothetical protein OXE76_10655 [Alphaproteobacteria bacterium]|nr:hypothetical protein [Alphaproteobacteria bacterium]